MSPIHDSRDMCVLWGPRAPTTRLGLDHERPGRVYTHAGRFKSIELLTHHATLVRYGFVWVKKDESWVASISPEV